MRGETDQRKLERFMTALGERVLGAGTIYLTGGATAMLAKLQRGHDRDLRDARAFVREP